MYTVLKAFRGFHSRNLARNDSDTDYKDLLWKIRDGSISLDKVKCMSDDLFSDIARLKEKVLCLKI